MSCQMLSSNSPDISAVLRHSRHVGVLRRAFPFKLKYLALSSEPLPPYLVLHRHGLGCDCRETRKGDLRARSASGQGEVVVEEEEEEEEEEAEPRRSSRMSVGSSRKKLAPKRPRDSGSNGFKVVSSTRTTRSFVAPVESRNLFNGSRGVAVVEDIVEDDFSDEDDLIKGFPMDSSKGVVSMDEDKSYLSQTRFDQCSISPLLLKGIQAAGYDRMTVVQEATLLHILKGKDVLAKAKTGTGKTVAFMLPAIKIVSELPSVNDKKKNPINVLVLCPTRELASQAATEASRLSKYYPSIGVQVVIGGTRLVQEQRRLQANPCQILVATPGRLKDHIENTPGFATRLMCVKVLVLDEADRLLDMGFRRDIEKIVGFLPKQRQTLLFSATVSNEVREISHVAMKRDHEFVNTVEEGSEETHSQVSQMHLIAPLDKHFPLLYHILLKHISEDVDYKVIVFCTTAMCTKLVSDLLSALHLNVREIHSRKSQSHRTKVSEEFKKAKGLILVSSDVSARGVDYPDVTLVIQIGVPSSREQYIHRLGRTGRKGKEGKGLLILAPWEKFFLTSIKDLPTVESQLPPIDQKTIKQVEMAMSNVEMKSKESAYQAWLGYYNSDKTIGRDKNNLVSLVNEFSRSMGLQNPPAITKLVLRKMGLSNVPGLYSK